MPAQLLPAPFSRPLGLALILAVGCPGAPAPLQAQNEAPPATATQSTAPRVWKDSTGKFQVEARLVEQTPTTVRLRAANGREVTVPRDRLSAADQEFLASLAVPSDNPFAAAMPESDAPSPASASAPGTLRSLPESPSAAASLALPDAGKTLDLTQVDAEKAFVPDAASPTEPPPSATIALGSVDPYDHVAPPVEYGTTGSKFLVSIGRNKLEKKEEIRGRIYLADLSAKASSLIWNQPESVRILDHDPPTGRTLLIQGLDQFDRGGILAMYEDLEGTSASPLYKRILPGAGKPGFRPRIEWAQMLSGSHVAVILDGAFLLWDLSSAQLVYKIQQVRSNDPPVFSANQRYMAVPQPSYVAIVETATGEVLARVPTQPGHMSGAAFDASGRLLAICFSNQYLVWDCVEERIVHQATTTAHLGSHPVHWLSPKMLLCSSGDVIDLELGMSVWKYSRPASTAILLRGGQLLTATTSSECVLVSIAVPHEAAQKSAEMLKRAGDEAMLVRPGSDVAIAVEALPGTDAAEIEKALAKAAQEAGWKVSPQAPITLVAKIGRGKPQELKFRGMGVSRFDGSRPPSTATLTPFTAELEIRRGTDVLWTRSSENRIPPILRLEEGETVQDAVKRYEKPDAAFFGRLDLPPRIPKPEIAASVGRSVLRDGQWYDVTGEPAPPARARSRR
ncbi:SHD1 domain-containing protein [Candidatus Laterigemmans baculatus]|uniref:SHD1 domain-containing protein n=1 Tax=Candidatus Laterigemmans baculatus TaxID=2770505 RepID=UPI0013DA4B42|nr:SHD1 domain-containing protein [Candidatus Laterigemmans baculatus]